MPPNQEFLDLKTIFDAYLSIPDYNNYPELDLYILNHQEVVDSYNNSMTTLKLAQKIQTELEVKYDDYGDIFFLERFIGTHIRLKNWSLKCTKIRGKYIVDFYCKELE